MFTPPTVRNGPSGTVLIKHAYGDDQAKLRRESEALAALKHLPGVVETQGFIELEDRSELTITYVEGAPLTEHPPFAIDSLLEIVLSVAKTLVAMHELGIRHGAINREHVLVDRHGGVLLCGFGAATSDATGGAQVSDDVRALASLLTFELERSTEAGIARAHRREAAEASAAATRLTSDASGASLARWIAQLETTLGSARAINAGPTSSSPRRLATPSTDGLMGRIKSVSPAAWIAVALVVVAGFVFYQTFKPDSGANATETTPTTALTNDATVTQATPDAAHTALDAGTGVSVPVPAEPADVAPDTASALVFAASPNQCAAQVAPDLAALGPPGALATFTVHTDGDGCADEVVLGVDQANNRPLVLIGDAKFEVGEPGDLLAVGDWSCDGIATPAVVRPSTGGVFVFGAWPSAGSVAPSAVAHVPIGATALSAQVPSPDVSGARECARLVVSVGEATYVVGTDSGVALLSALN